VLCEYIWRIYQQTRLFPRYVIAERLGRPQRPLESQRLLDPADLRAADEPETAAADAARADAIGMPRPAATDSGARKQGMWR
jgi:hypothetical protein